MLSKNRNFRLIVCMAISVVIMSGITSCSKDEADYREKFLGAYSGEERYTDGGIPVISPYTVTVTKSNESSGKVVISAEFMVVGRTENVAVDVSKDGSFFTSFASVVDGVSQTVQVSSGKFANGTLTYSYYVQGYFTYTVNVNKL